ncbi:MAG TPA: RNA polymerase sigma factor RpoD/SigA [Candidatus Sulfotelmatobacter sp.]|nr:RNA polymerase sigma factor RpoD/SigA [Candidatus Sulfotelmatobacter sp.]
MAGRGPGFYGEVSDEGLASYLKGIRAIPLIPKAEELKLAAQVRRGDERALKRLVEANLRFVVQQARKYQGHGLSLSDLINEGNLGLLEAARRYLPDHGVKFITYAVWWIRQAIMQALATSRSGVRLPLRKARLVAKAKEAWTDLAQAQQREPSERDVARALRVAPEELEDVLRVQAAGASLDDELQNEERLLLRLYQQAAAPPADEELIHQSLREDVKRLVAGLKDRERKVIELRYGLGAEDPMTLEEVGRRLRLSRERIRQIEERAKRQLWALARQRRLKEYLN